MDQASGRTCPQCGTARIGNFRWCRTCGHDFDAERVAAPGARPTFVLTPRPETRSAPASPAASPSPSGPEAPSASRPPALQRPATGQPAPAARATSASASASASAGPSPSRRSVVTAAIVAVVGVAVVIGVGLWRGAGIAATATSTPPLTSGSTQDPATASEPASDSLTGDGDGNVEFPVTPGRAGIASIIHEGEGTFAVWTVASDGSDEDQLVNATGPFAGTKLFNPASDRLRLRVETDGRWSIEVHPAAEARTWSGKGRVVGDGPDVILVFPATARDVDATAIHDGDRGFRIWAYAGEGRQPVLDEVGRERRDVVIPAGTSLLEIEADAAWALAPLEP
jgi:hypothetical protein